MSAELYSGCYCTLCVDLADCVSDSVSGVGPIGVGAWTECCVEFRYLVAGASAEVGVVYDFDVV